MTPSATIRLRAPCLELRLHQRHDPAARGEQRGDRRQTRRSEMKERQSQRPRKLRQRGQVPDIGPFHRDDPRIGAQRPGNWP